MEIISLENLSFSKLNSETPGLYLAGVRNCISFSAARFVFRGPIAIAGVRKLLDRRFTPAVGVYIYIRMLKYSTIATGQRGRRRVVRGRGISSSKDDFLMELNANRRLRTEC